MRIALILVILSVAGATGWLLFSTDSPSDGEDERALSIQNEALALNGVRLFEKKYNSVVMELIASKGLISLDETRTDLEKFTLVSHTEKIGVITLTAEKGTMINATYDVTAEGNVLARDDKGRALLTDSLDWINSDRHIKTQDRVRIFGDRFVISGVGMVADTEAEKVEILSNVKAVFRDANE